MACRNGVSPTSDYTSPVGPSTLASSVTVDDMAMAINDRRVRILQTVLIMRHCELQVD